MFIKLRLSQGQISFFVKVGSRWIPGTIRRLSMTLSSVELVFLNGRAEQSVIFRLPEKEPMPGSRVWYRHNSPLQWCLGIVRRVEHVRELPDHRTSRVNLAPKDLIYSVFAVKEARTIQLTGDDVKHL